jgi:tetratricopeptide (TPR) repeat protein
MIERLALAEATTVPADRADGYVRAAGICWNLGYRVKARELVSRALAADSTFYPAMIFGVHFAIGEGDTSGAIRLFRKAGRLEPANPASVNFKRIFQTFDSLLVAAAGPGKSALFMRISSAYRDLGISDAAIENARLACNADSANMDAAMTLAGMYELKRRWSPARNILTRAAAIRPDDPLVREQLEAVEAHF